jgi:hypothetical protein
MSLRSAELPPRSQRYGYSLLNKDRREIRLVQIKPDADSTSPIQLILRTAALAQHDDASESCQANSQNQERAGSANPARTESDIATEHSQTDGGFIALSYVWGSEKILSDVRIEDSSGSGWLSVRQNLHDFLTTRRNSSVHSPWFWIDQLCINQSDDQERGHQVYQMSQIYLTAISVEVWLGLGFEGSNEVMDFLSHLAVERRVSTKAEKTIHRPALERIARLPYWSRLWVVQEVNLGRDISARLGDRAAPWPGAFILPFSEIKSAWQLRELVISGRETPPGGHHWGSVWELAGRKDCSNVRDRVFAMMGMVADSLRFYPDYSMSLQDILLMILRLQTAFLILLPTEHHDDISRTTSMRYCIERCAYEWYWILDSKQHEIEPKAVRDFLLNEIRPLLHGPPYVAYLKTKSPLTRRLKSMFSTLGSGPTALSRLRLRLLLPDRYSILWDMWDGRAEGYWEKEPIHIL